MPDLVEGSPALNLVLGDRVIGEGTPRRHGSVEVAVDAPGASKTYDYLSLIHISEPTRPY